MEIKKTLLMPKTKFEMRGNLSVKEPNIRKSWQQLKIYDSLIEKNKGKKPFVLHDGPPYANGNIHIGHALNKILKDFVVRYKSMNGFHTPFIPGWDTHGLPIENAVIKTGIDRNSVSISEFRKVCQKYAFKQINAQSKQFQALGTIGDYENPYYTLDKEYEASQINIFSDLALKGLIFKGLKPVYWSPSSESALAESEIEYKDKEDTSIYVKFRVNDGKGILDNDANFVIWTTTPWTIPANLAISLNPRMEYGLYDTNKGKLIYLTSLNETLKEELGLDKSNLIKTFKGSELEFITCSHPFYDRDSLVIVGDHVSDEAGTGCVHTAPGHGAEDFIVGKKYNLDVLCPVDEKGKMTKEAGEDLEGLFYEKANEKVLEKLENAQALLAANKFTHSYPHDWRSDKPVIFRATDQWFASIDKIKDDLLNSIKEIDFKNPWGEIRITNMIKDRKDWCISRQRYWGVPIPIIYNEDDTPIIEKEVFDHIEKIVREKGSNAWYELSEEELLPEGYTNKKSPNNNFRKEKDTMDVWFDSGTSHTGVLINRGLGYPADLYLEGSDQYRGWFNSSLILGVLKHGKSPYKQLVSHGFVVDGKGAKMSKSVGNVVDPLQILETHGADILRLWVASIDYQADTKISDDILKQVSENYRKIRNTLKFLVGNLSNGSEEDRFDPSSDTVSEFELIDLYVLERLKEVSNTYLDHFDNYNFMGAFHTILNFITIELSSLYLDIAKDILYCETKESLRRRQVQSVIYKLLDTLIRLLTPFIPHTMDELYAHFDNSVISTALLDMPVRDSVDTELISDFKLLINLRDDVLKAIEEARNSEIVRSSQEASIELEIKDDKTKEVFDRLSDIEQNRFFIVSEVKQVNLDGLNKLSTAKVRVSYHTGEKCERCWNKFTSSEMVDNVCQRCNDAIEYYKEKLDEEE